MILQVFETLSMALSGDTALALAAALAWGILSILLSPCHLSGIPLIISYISAQKQITLIRSFALSLIFAIGILITIAIIGIITASMGRLIGDIGFIGNLAVASVLILIGLYLLDLISLPYDGLSLQTQKKGPLAALILGLLFGLGLGPCTFAYMAPVLGVVFHVSQTHPFYAGALIGAFGIGHIAVIVLAGTFTQAVQRYLNWADESHTVAKLRRICGMLVVAAGLYWIYQTLWP
jgi:cytochrome c-type biogenesis protein